VSEEEEEEEEEKEEEEETLCIRWRVSVLKKFRVRSQPLKLILKIKKL